MFLTATKAANVVVVVGGECLFGGDHIRCRCVEVSLPDPVVMHSSNAVSSLVTNLINNVFTEVTGIRISKHFKIATIHFKSGFNSWPCSADVATYHNRFDNMNCVFRVHGVDAGATRRFWGAKVQPILRQNLLFHCSIGMNSSRTARLCSCIEAEEYVRTLCGPPPRKALTEQNFVQAVYDSIKNHSTQSTPDDPGSGLYTWEQDPKDCVVARLLEWYELDVENTIVVLLTPNGVKLHTRSNFEEWQMPDNVFIDRPWRNGVGADCRSLPY